MKITEEELIQELEERRDRARETLKEAHEMKLPQNSYGLGVEYGEMITCSEILDLIKDGIYE